MSGTPLQVSKLLAQLVSIPSVNPQGDPGVEVPGEAACAAFLGEYLDGLGADVSIEDVVPGRPNVVGKFPSDRAGKPVVLFAPHTDTVSVVGMTIDPFAAEVRSGRLYGRGASDTKGPMAAMLAALAARADAIPSLPVEVWFAGLMGEEAGQLGAHALAAACRPDFVVVGEPTGLGIVHAHKGAMWMQVEAAGRAAHASTPELGDNAIYKMIEPLRVLHDDVLPMLDAIRDPVLGSPTLSVNVLRGGSKTNIVPDRCTCEIDIRTVPAMDIDGFARDVAARLESVSPGVAVTVQTAAALNTRPEGVFFDCLIEAGAPLATAPWFCDAAVFGQLGVPAVAVGPGHIAQAHTADEFIALDDLEAGAEYFARFLDRLAVAAF